MKRFVTCVPIILLTCTTSLVLGKDDLRPRQLAPGGVVQPDSVWEPAAAVASAATTCLASSPAQQEMMGLQPLPKNRFVSVIAGDPGQRQTIRVIWSEVPNWPGGVAQLAGQRKWLMEPLHQVCENSSNRLNITPPDCGPAPGQPQKWFWVGFLTCDPAQAWYADLHDLTNYCNESGEPCTTDADCAFGTCGVDGVIHITDEGMAPSKLLRGGGAIAQPARYTVQVVDETCPIGNDVTYSDPVDILTAGWSDVVAGPGSCPLAPPNLFVAVIGDVTELLNKFINAPCAPKKTRIDLEPAPVDFDVDFMELALSVAAFAGRDYNFFNGDPCAIGREP